MQEINLAHLQRKRRFYEETIPNGLRNVLETPASFDWFVKNNRKTLLDKGALVRIGRDLFINTEIFPQVAEALLCAKVSN